MCWNLRRRWCLNRKCGLGTGNIWEPRSIQNGLTTENPLSIDDFSMPIIIVFESPEAASRYKYHSWLCTLRDGADVAFPRARGGCRPENRNTLGIITYQQSRKITETYGNNMKRLSDLGDWKWMKMGYEITMLFTISGKIKQYDRRFIFASTKCVTVNFLQFVSEKEYGWVIYHPTRIQYTCVI